MNAIKSATVIKTSQAEINGKFVNVQTMHGGRDRQDIFYMVNGRVISSDNFWKKKPVFVN